ncbi:MAG: hypothetical protein KKF77_07465 [Proteobacteria bacterium]|nr:hypothetical protein [Pseudomonadota bacterium]
MPTSVRFRDATTYALIVVVSFAALQTVVVLSHEFTHSTMAWLLGHMDSPLDIIWGNPLTMTGWDEGVGYRDMFATGQLVDAAIIGVCPLVMHWTIVVFGLALLRRGRPRGRWSFHFLYWFVVANLMELIAYILMRAFAQHGDVGLFNRGLGLNPWFIFVGGSAALAYALAVLFGRAMPNLCMQFAHGNRPAQWLILLLTAFALFLWGSGLRVVLYVYPDPQWQFGLLGFACFGAALVACAPSRPWLIRRMHMY